jgi:hypothetical protein
LHYILRPQISYLRLSLRLLALAVDYSGVPVR